MNIERNINKDGQVEYKPTAEQIKEAIEMTGVILDSYEGPICAFGKYWYVEKGKEPVEMEWIDGKLSKKEIRDNKEKRGLEIDLSERKGCEDRRQTKKGISIMELKIYSKCEKEQDETT